MNKLKKEQIKNVKGGKTRCKYNSSTREALCHYKDSAGKTCDGVYGLTYYRISCSDGYFEKRTNLPL